MYEPNIDSTTGLLVPNTIKRSSDGVVIEFDITNIDYQNYLDWAAEQNPMPMIKNDEPTINPMIFPNGWQQDNSLT